MSAIAIYCQKSHDNAVVSNYDAMVQQLSAYCNNALVTVGPIVINSTIVNIGFAGQCKLMWEK
jgi:hypothetical protein